MGIDERRNSERIRMKKHILEAAIQIINEEGYERLTIRKIATKIEYSPTSIYLYYKDKAQILGDLANQLYLKTEMEGIKVAKKYAHLPVQELLGRVLKGFVESLCAEPEMAKAIMLGGSSVIFSGSPPGEVPSNQGMRYLEHLFDLGVEQGTVRPEVRQTSWMLVSALLGFVMCVIENNLYITEDFEKQVECFVQVLLGGILL